MGSPGSMTRTRRFARAALRVLPFPYLGDLLLFLLDEDGVYCVNWTVKQDEDDFTHPRFKPPISTKNQQASIRKETARHEIEATYYSDTGEVIFHKVLLSQRQERPSQK